MQSSVVRRQLPAAAQIHIPGCRPAHPFAIQPGLLHQSRKMRRPRQTRSRLVSVHASIDVWQTISQLKGGAASLAVFLETAPPPLYLVYMLAAGFGIPCSEDALVVWVGSNIFNGVYGGWQGIAYVLSIVYFGVVVSDMVTFFMGVALQKGLFKSLKNSLFSNSNSFDRAINVINKRSRTIGAIQRFSLGFRGPLCLVCGFTGVPPARFALGAAVGALGTMPLQLTVGYYLRHTPNPYLTALAVVSAPNLCGQLLGPIATAAGLYFAGKEQPNQQKPGEASATTKTVDS